MLKKINVSKVKKGTIIQDLNENRLECVNVVNDDVKYFEFKYIRSDGSLSKGSDFLFPSHFYGYKLIQY